MMTSSGRQSRLFFLQVDTRGGERVGEIGWIGRLRGRSGGWGHHLLLRWALHVLRLWLELLRMWLLMYVLLRHELMLLLALRLLLRWWWGLL
jgi:hypothetical protein